MDELKQKLNAALTGLTSLSWVQSGPDLVKAKEQIKAAIAEADRLSAMVDTNADPLLVALASWKHTGVILIAVAVALVLAGVGIGINI